MADFKLDEFDHIKPDQALNRKLMQKMDDTLTPKEPFMKQRILKLAVAMAVVIGVFTLPLFGNNRTFIDYAGFLRVYADEIEQPLLEIAAQEELLDQAVLEEAMTQEQYDQAIQELEEQKDVIEERKGELMEEYQIEEDMNLEEVIFSQDKEEDARLKDLYAAQNQLLEAQQVKEQAQAQLEADYKTSKITLAEYVASKQEMVTDGKEMAKLDDRIEQIVKSSYFSSLSPTEKQEVQAISKQQQEVDRELKKAAIEEKKLLQDFLKDKITYEEYITRKNDLNNTRKELTVLDETLSELEDKVVSASKLDHGQGDKEDKEDVTTALADSTETTALTETTTTEASKTAPSKVTTSKETTSKVTTTKAITTNDKPAQTKPTVTKRMTTKKNK